MGEAAVNLPQCVNLLYDNNGNLTNDGTRSFGYNTENQLTNVFVPGQWRSDFVCDGLGRRRIVREFAWNGNAWAKTNELHIIYDGYLPIQERDSNNNVLVTYTRGLDLSGSLSGAGGIGGLLARTDANGSTFYHSDGAGNITALMDGQENIVARYMYGPFGTLVGQWGSMASANEMQFSSMPRDSLSGLSLYPFRAYEPNFQRWLNQDPIRELGGINLYRAMNNNPLIRIDPFGLVLPGDLPFPEGGGGGGGDIDAFEEANQDALLNEALTIQNQAAAQQAANAQFEQKIAQTADEAEGEVQRAQNLLNPGTSSSAANSLCPSKKPIVIGQNMKDRVQPFANDWGLDSYKPSRWFDNPDDLNDENMKWINQMMDEGRDIYNLGTDPNAPSPSAALENELNEIYKRNYPINSFETFNGHGI